MATHPTKRGQVKCGCGSVVLDLVIPPDSQTAEDFNVLCQCTDCVGFPDACFKAGTAQVKDVVDRKHNYASQVFNYHSDIGVTKGNDQIKWHKVRPDAKNLRFYAKCCGQPLGFSPGGFPTMVMLYGALLEDGSASGDVQLLNQNEEIYKIPKGAAVLFSEDAPSDSIPIPDGIPVYEGIYSPEVYNLWVAKANAGAEKLSCDPNTRLQIPEANMCSVGDGPESIIVTG